MPSLDFRLLAALVQDPLASHARLGRRLEVSAEAVRKRLQHLREDGVLAGVTAVPAAAVFSRTEVGIGFDRPIALDELLGLEDAVWAATSFDEKCGVMGYTHDREAFIDRAVALAGRPPIQTGGLQPTKQVPPLGPLEWRVLRALVEEPSADLRRLSAMTGLSYRTVRSRRDWLIEKGAVKIDPLLRPSKSSVLYYHLWVTLKTEQDEPAVRKALGDHIVINRYRNPPSLYVFCCARDLASHAALVHALERRDEVTTLHVVFNADYALHTKRVQSWIDDELAAWRKKSEG